MTWPLSAQVRLSREAAAAAERQHRERIDDMERELHALIADMEGLQGAQIGALLPTGAVLTGPARPSNLTRPHPRSQLRRRSTSERARRSATAASPWRRSSRRCVNVSKP